MQFRLFFSGFFLEWAKCILEVLDLRIELPIDLANLCLHVLLSFSKLLLHEANLQSGMMQVIFESLVLGLDHSCGFKTLLKIVVKLLYYGSCFLKRLSIDLWLMWLIFWKNLQLSILQVLILLLLFQLFQILVQFKIDVIRLHQITHHSIGLFLRNI